MLRSALLGLAALARGALSASCPDGVCVLPPLVALTGMSTEAGLTLPPLTPAGNPWPANVTAVLTLCHEVPLVVANVSLALWSGDARDGGGVRAFPRCGAEGCSPPSRCGAGGWRARTVAS